MADWWDDYIVSGARNNEAAGEKPWWEEYVIGRRVVPPQPKAPDTPPPNSLESAWERFKGSSRLGVAGLTQAAGWPEWTKALKEQADANEAEADRYQPPVPSYKDVYKEGDILGSIGRGGRYLYDTAVGSLPNMGATIVGGIAGAPLGPAGMAVGAIAANTPSYIGSNLREQMEQNNIPFEKTDILPAAGTAIVQSGLDALPVGRLGLGKAATGAIGSRIAKKAGEGVLLEAPTEVLQEALQIVQANPQRLLDFSPEIQERLINAGVGGAALGGTMGGIAGGIKGRKQTNQTTQEEEPLSEPFSPSEYFPPPTEYVPNGTGLPIENTPLGIDSGTGLPEFTRIPEWTPMGTGLPVEPGGEVPTDMGFKPTADTGIAPVRIIEKNGQKVYDNIKDQLYGRFNPIQVNAIANFQRKRYEALGAQLGVSPWDAFTASNVTIDVSGSKPKIEPTTDPAVILNQDETDIGMDEQTPVVMRSALVSALNKINMKEGTGQQWMNALKKAGVKDEEIEWTGVKGWLDDAKQGKLTSEQMRYIAGNPYKLAVYEAKPHDQNKTSHYGQWTLGEYGSNPESNYREVVISNESTNHGYNSPHFQMVPNYEGHYRTTSRTLSDGRRALHAEEFQADGKQEARKRGYMGTPQQIEDANNNVQDLRPLVATVLKENDYLGFDRLQDAFAYISAAQYPPSQTWEFNNTQDAEIADNYYTAVNLRNKLTTGVPDAPFKQSWPNMLFRHALADAINQDKDALTWNTGTEMPNVEAWGPEKKPGDAGYEEDAKRRKAMLEFYDKRIVDYANKLGKPFGVQVEKQTVTKPETNLTWEWDGNRLWVDNHDGSAAGIYSYREAKEEFGQDFMTAVDRAKSINEMSGTYTKPGTSAEVWSLPINDTMQEVLRAGGLPLFQREGATTKGNISLLPDKTIIRLFKNSDVSTVMHEFSHLHLAEMERYAAQNKEIAQGLATFKSWAGLEPDGKIGNNEQELWARGFEEYLATGKAPNAAMRDLFEQFKQWLIDIYKKMKNIVASRPAQYRDLKLTPDMRKVFDSLTTTKEQQTEERTTPLPPREDKSTILTQSGTRDVDEMRGNMLRANDNTDERSWTPEFYQRMAQAENTRAKAYEDKAATWKKYAEKAMEDRRKAGRNLPGAKAKAFLDGMESYKADAAEARRMRDEYLSRANALNSRTFEQAEQPKSLGRRIMEGAQRIGADAFDPQSRVPNQRDYLGKRIETRGDMYRWDVAGRDAMKLYEKLTPDQQETVTQYFEGAKDITAVPQPLRAQTRAIKERIEKLGQDLVDKGVLKQETYDANKGSYSPRLFMKHFMSGQGLAGGFKPNLGETKKRKNLSMEERLALGEIRHPGLTMRVALTRMGRDVASLNFLGEIAKNPDWFHPNSTIDFNGKKVTPDWLRAEAVEVRDRAAKIKEFNPDQAAEMNKLADDMDAAARSHSHGEYDPKEWKKMPDTKQYGALRGGYVRKQIADDITGMTDFVDENSWAAQLLGDKNSAISKATQYWKSLKVPMNIASHGRNLIGNMIQLHVFGGIPPQKVFSYILSASRQMRDNGKAWQVAKQYGIPHGNMGEAEFRALADSLAQSMDRVSMKGPTPYLAMWRGFENVREKMQDFYQKSESLFKTAVIAYELDKGTSPREAALRADDAIFDYGLVSPSIKYLRNSPLGAPFITWTYKAMPMLVKTATDPKTMHRYLPYIALGSLVPALVASMNDLKDDDPERLRKALSEALRRKASMYLLPWKDMNGRWQFLDVGYFLPWQMPQEVFTALSQGRVDEALKATPLLSSPVINIVTAIKTGEDPFTGRPIMDKKDPPYDQVVSLMKYLWDMATPSVLSSYGMAGKAYDAMTGSGTNRYGEPPADWAQIVARGAGLNTYSVDPEAQRGRNLRKMQHDIQDIRSQMTLNMKDQSLTPDQRKALMERFISKIRDRQEEMVKYSRESAMTPSLSAATNRR